ncbi:RmlC-like cupin domain-containing protein [Delphinella strobiligena]|nr:RmlC-like cupin domain-containing protein [Delphinella strobiligena]
MSTPLHVTKAASIKTSGGQTEGMIRQNAIVSISEKLCASVMIAKPHTGSAIHHHGEQDTIVYAASGHGTVVSEGGKKRQDLSPGDFALIPAYAEHQEVNDGDDDVTWIITRSGKDPIVSNLEGWGKS